MGKGTRWTEAERRALAGFFAEGLEWPSIQDMMEYQGYPRRTIEAYLREIRNIKNGRSGGGTTGYPPKNQKKKAEVNHERGEIRGSNISTLDELFELAGENRDDWEILKNTLQYSNGKISQLWVQARPLIRTSALREVEKAILSEIREASKGTVKKIVYPRFNRRLLGVLGLLDVHLAKLAWREETGQNYDMKIAEAYVKNAVLDLLDETDRYGIERFMVPVGQDFFHTDTLEYTTARGTRQDVDGRWQKAFDKGYELWVWIIEQILTRGPVDVIFSPGNHDKQTSYFLNRALDARFHHHPDVRVDIRPDPRKYYRWGGCLLGITHGNEEKLTQLPDLMAGEAPGAWGETWYREWLIGHLHKRETMLKERAEDGGVRVQRLSSLAGTDAYHNEKGFTCSLRAATALVYDADRGLRHEVHHTLPPDPEELRAKAPLVGLP